MVDKHWKLQLGSTLASTFGISSDEESIDDPSWQQIYHELLQLDGGITNDNGILSRTCHQKITLKWLS